MSLRRPHYGTWWIGATSGRAMLTRRFVGLVNLVRIRHIRPIVVGDSDSISETTRVAAVTWPRSGPDQLKDLLRRLLLAVDPPAPIPEVPPVEKLLQRLVTETQNRPSPVVSPPASAGLELRSFLSGQQPTRPPPRPRPVRLEQCGVFFMWKVGSYAATRCPNLDESFPFRQQGWGAEKTPGGSL